MIFVVCYHASIIANSRESPAPLSLCSIQNNDLEHDATLCPIERRSLKEFYDLAKGREWTESTNWVDEYKSCCDWAGITCDSDTNTIVMKLDLRNNGLSGKVSSSIGRLTFLEVLNLSDNDMKVNSQQYIYLYSAQIYFAQTMFSQICCTILSFPGQHSIGDWTAFQSHPFAPLLQRLQWKCTSRAWRFKKPRTCPIKQQQDFRHNSIIIKFSTRG